MATHKLTDIACKRAKATDKTLRLVDGRGLHLEVPVSGNKRWRYRYRYEGKANMLTVGLYPEVSLSEAREKVLEMRRQLVQGLDPSAVRKAQKAAIYATEHGNFELIAREWFAKNKATWSASHAKVTMQRLERDVFPWLGDRPIAEITAQEVLATLNRIVDRGAIETAHRVKSLISQVFRYAIATDRVPHDVTSGLIGALPPSPENHLAAILDTERLGQILRMFDGYQGGLVVSCALKLTPLLFVRPGELRTMEWADVDLETGKWRFELSKTKQPHIVPLSRQAIAILKEIHPLTRLGKYVFPSARTAQRPMSNAAITSALRAMGLSGDEVTAHGFRATARTLLDEVLGYRPDWIEHQLGHTVKDPLGRAYNRTTFLSERREMMQAWADYLDKLKGAV